MRAVQQRHCRRVTIDHDDVVITTGDVAACAAGAELDLEAKEPM